MKRFISVLLILVMCLSFSVTCFADPTTSETPPTMSEDEPSGPNRPEETIWYFRTYNGMAQMRLWSLTYRKWLTPWIDIGPVDP